MTEFVNCTLIKTDDLDRLRAELEALKTDIETYVRISSGQATANESLRAENAALREDAERYRWLRQQDWEIMSRKSLAIRVYASEDEDESTNADVLDTAIDAARAALQGAKDD